MKKRQSVRTAVIVNQIRERFGNWQFDAVVVSCGTCRESLTDMDVETIFSCPMMDVSRFVLESGLSVTIEPGRFYHAPCHDSLMGTGQTMISGLGESVAAVPHCCGEAGTLALSRPEIAGAMRARKRDAFQAAARPSNEEKIVLTNCPSCLTGLGRVELPGLKTRHLAEELAIALDGKNWLKESRAWREKARPITF